MATLLEQMRQISPQEGPVTGQSGLLESMKRLRAYQPIPAPMAAPRPPQEPGGIAEGIGERARSLGAGFFRGAQRAHEYIESPLAEPFGAIARGIEPKAPSYVPVTSWEDVKSAAKAGKIGQTAMNVVKFGLETGAISTPDMLAAITNLPVYVTARAGEILEDRRTAKGKIEAEDFAYALGAAGASGALERVGAKGLMTGPVGGTLREIATEAIQEPIELAGSRAGTPQEPTLGEYGEAALIGGVAAGPYAAAASGAYSAAEKAASALGGRGGPPTGRTPPGPQRRVEPTGPAPASPAGTRPAPAPAAEAASRSAASRRTLEAMQKVLRDAQASSIELPEARARSTQAGVAPSTASSPGTGATVSQSPGRTEAPTQSQPPQGRPGPHISGPAAQPGLAEFLASLGGVQDQTGELKAMDADKWHREKAYRRKLVSDEGLAPDYAREAAEEAGLLPQGSDLNDFYNALDADLRGEQAVAGEVDPDAERAAMEAEAEEMGLTPAEIGVLNNFQLQQRMQEMTPPEWLYTFPGPIQDIQKIWQKQVADPILNRLNFYPFKDLALGKVPGREEYLTRRGLAQGQVFRINRATNRLAESLRKASPDHSAAAFEYLTTAGASPNALPESVRNPAIAAKSSIKKLGQELVRRGLLSQEAVDKHADAYLPRVYLKFLLERTDFGSGLRKSDQAYLKSRMDLPEEYRDLWLGEIKDVPFLVTKALSQPARDLAIQDFLKDVAGDERWTLPESIIEWTAPGMDRPRKVTPFWLKKEAELLRERARRMSDKDQRSRAMDIATDMEAQANEALRNRPHIPKDFREMPNSPRYGELRGMVVHKQIHDDIVGGPGMWIGEKGLYDRTFDTLGTLNAFWKMMKVPFNPPTQVRNFVSNAVLLDMSGVPAQRLPGLYARAFQEMRHNGEHYRIAVKHGIPASTFTAEELYRIQPDILRVRGEKGGIVGRIARMAEPIARLGQVPGDVYQFSETLGKTVKIIDAMEREGLSENEAVAAAQEALFDYSLVPNLVKSLRSRPIGAPFMTFYYKAFPAILKGAMRHPAKMAKYYVIPYVLGDLLISAMRDVDEDDIDKLRKALPQWLQDQGHVYIFPYKDESGRWDFVNYGYFLPWAMHERTARNVMELATGEYGGSVNDFFSELGVLGGPVPQAISALQTGVDPFTQREIVKDTDPPKEQLYKLMMYAWTMAGPSWLTERGAAGHLYRSATGTPNYYGEPPASMPQSAARMLGMNIYPTDPVTSRQRNIQRKVWEIRDTERAMRGAMRDQSLSAPGRKQLQQEYRATIENLIAELERYRKESEVNPRLR